MKSRSLSRLLYFVVLLAVYVTSYLIFRQQSIERRVSDHHDYVIFPAGTPVVYYIYRPLTYLDARFTGMRFHIGPHAEAP